MLVLKISHLPLLLWRVWFLCPPLGVASEFSTYAFVFSGEAKNTVFDTFFHSSKEEFHKFLLHSTNSAGLNSAIPSITIDDGLCNVVRKELLTTANTWPYNYGKKTRRIFLVYANFTGPPSPTVTSPFIPHEDEIRYICCEKAVRNIVDTFIICGFSARPFGSDGKPRSGDNADDKKPDNAEYIEELANVLEEQKNTELQEENPDNATPLTAAEDNYVAAEEEENEEKGSETQDKEKEPEIVPFQRGLVIPLL